MRSLKRTRRLMKGQSSVTALAIFFTLAPFAFLFEGGASHLASDPGAPVAGGATLFTVAVPWIVYLVMRLRLKVL